MKDRSQPWAIAADIDQMAKALRDFEAAWLRVDKSAWNRISDLVGNFDCDLLATALHGLADEYQAIADADPDDRAADELRTGFREEDSA